MKKILVLLAVLSACSLFAQKLVSDPCNLKLNAKKIAPLGWYVQAVKAEHANVFYNERGENKRTIKFTPKKEQVLFYCGTAIKAAKGDVIILTVKAKGKGPFSIGYISYGEKGSNNFSYYEPVELTEKEQTFTKSIEIKDNEQSGKKTEIIRVAIVAKRGAEVEISSFGASMEE